RTSQRLAADGIQPTLEQQRAVFAGAELEAAFLGRPLLLGRETLGVEGVPKVVAEVPKTANAELTRFLEQLGLLEGRGRGGALEGVSRPGHQRQMGVADLATRHGFDAAREVGEVLADSHAAPPS